MFCPSSHSQFLKGVLRFILISDEAATTLGQEFSGWVLAIVWHLPQGVR